MPISVVPDGIATLTANELLKAFAATYRGKYGYYYDDVPVELVTVHVTGVAGAEVDALPELASSHVDASPASQGERRAYSARLVVSCRSQSTAAISCVATWSFRDLVWWKKMRQRLCSTPERE